MILKPLYFLKKSVQFLLKDKISLSLSLIPIFIGLILYFSSFYYLNEALSNLTHSFLSGWLNSESFIIKILLYLIKGLLAIIGYFLVNWTFVLIVSLLGSPLNDFISERVEKKMYGKTLKNLKQSFSHIGSKIIFILFNEIKKISFILILSSLVFILGYIPFLTPFALALSFLLVSIQFVDYVWARHDIKFKQCFQDIMKNLGFYTLSGAIYFLLISIPIINLFVPALATIHFTYSFNDKNSGKIVG